MNITQKILSFLFIVGLFSCKKEEPIALNNDESVKGTIEILYFPHTTPAEKNYYTISYITKEGNKNWEIKKDGLPSSNPFYKNGLIYIPWSNYDEVNLKSLGGLDVININTGELKWSNSNHSFFDLTIRNDTLFCHTISTLDNKVNLQLYNSITGQALFNKELVANTFFSNHNSILENTNLYYLSAVYGTKTDLTAFDIFNKEVKWQIKVGWYTPEIIIDNEYLYYCNGYLAALNKNTGNKIWEKDSMSYESPFCSAGLLLALDVNFNLVAFDAKNGLKKWIAPSSIGSVGGFKVVGNSVYSFGTTYGSGSIPNKYFVSSIRLTDGQLKWKKEINVNGLWLWYRMMIIGNKFYVRGSNPSTQFSIFTFDTETGDMLDTKTFVNGFESQIVYITSKDDFRFL